MKKLFVIGAMFALLPVSYGMMSGGDDGQDPNKNPDPFKKQFSTPCDEQADNDDSNDIENISQNNASIPHPVQINQNPLPQGYMDLKTLLLSTNTKILKNVIKEVLNTHPLTKDKHDFMDTDSSDSDEDEHAQ